MYNFIKAISEGRTPKELKQVPLEYSRSALDPSLSKESLDYHYGHLYKAYVDRFNAGEGDANFNEAGAFLHSMYFSQFKPYAKTIDLDGSSLAFIEKNFKTFDQFKKEFLKTAMSIQGSGWCYLAKSGSIKTIVNHEIKDDIILLVDWWEHSFQFDFGSDKEKYLNGQWKIIDWSVIDERLNSK